jgi:hypothetical protein
MRAVAAFSNARAAASTSASIARLSEQMRAPALLLDSWEKSVPVLEDCPHCFARVLPSRAYDFRSDE